jgi:hypothetical protein
MRRKIASAPAGGNRFEADTEATRAIREEFLGFPGRPRGFRGAPGGAGGD